MSNTHEAQSEMTKQGTLPPLDSETLRLAKVAIDESAGAPMVADWMDAALKVCRAALAAQAPQQAQGVAGSYQAGWDACMSLWADHMKRMNAALNAPMKLGYANHAAELHARMTQELATAPQAASAPQALTDTDRLDAERWRYARKALSQKMFEYYDLEGMFESDIDAEIDAARAASAGGEG